MTDDEPPADAVHLNGRSVDLVEALSLRMPFPDVVAVHDRWLFDGLASAFDRVPGS